MGQPHDLLDAHVLDGDIEELDLDAWHEMDLDRIPQPEGWAGDDLEDDDDDEDDEDDDDWDEDDEENDDY